MSKPTLEDWIKQMTPERYEALRDDPLVLKMIRILDEVADGNKELRYVHTRRGTFLKVVDKEDSDEQAF